MIISQKSECYPTRQKVIEPPKFIFIHSGYKATIARDEAEVLDALQLRYEVFRKKLQNGDDNRPDADDVETDHYDASAIHLIVRHLQTGIVVGTYRLQSWEMAQAGLGFYAANQFNINGIPDPFLKQSIEIGRGCIHKNHRNGRVLFMLWKGLAASLDLYGQNDTVWVLLTFFQLPG